MDGLNLGFWICSCCNQVFHTDLQRPVNLFGNELFKCALCNAVFWSNPIGHLILRQYGQ
ncbi:hypothetical protein DIKCMJMK_04422 [Shewanella oneidensis]|nr:hypothetical protein [Shewanella oneidensis]